MVYNIVQYMQKRSRDTDDRVLNVPKKRRLDAVRFNIEPIDEDDHPFSVDKVRSDVMDKW